MDVLVRRWNAALLAPEHQSELPDAVRRQASVLHDPASEEAIRTLEERLGTTLPPSYRAFLAVTNGAWAKPRWGVVDPEGPVTPTGMLGTSDVGWTRDLEPDLIAAWMDDEDPDVDPDEPDEVYFDYSLDHDCVTFRRSHLPHTLLVSCFDWGEAVLLNSAVVGADGEWEAWSFGNSYPGAFRYTSFAALLEDEVRTREQETEELRAAAPRRRAEWAELLAARFDDPRARDLDHLAAVARDHDAPAEMRGWAVKTLAEAPAIEPLARDALIAAYDAGLVDDPFWLVKGLVRDPESHPFLARVLRENTSCTLAQLAHDRDLLWQAWQEGRPRHLLPALIQARVGGPVIEASVEALRDAELDPEVREHLLSVAGALPGPDVVGAVVEAAQYLRDPYLAASALTRLGAADEVVALVEPVTRDPQGAFAHLLADLGNNGHDPAMHLLIRRFRARPSRTVASYLANCRRPEVREVLEEYARRARHAKDAVDALYWMHDSESLTILERLAASDGPAAAAAQEAVRLAASDGLT